MQGDLGNTDIKGAPINRELIEHRLDEAKQSVDKLEQKVDTTLVAMNKINSELIEVKSKMVTNDEWTPLNTSIQTIKSSMVTRTQLLLAALGLVGVMVALVCTIVVHFFMKYMPMSGGN